MPLYEYQCEECGRVNEFLVRKVGEAPDRTVMVCDRCGGTHLRRMLSTTACRSSGSGSSCTTGMCSLNRNEQS